MKKDGRPQNLPPEQREKIIATFHRRKIIRHVLHGAVGICIILIFAAYRYEETFFGLDSGTERGIFMGIAGVVFLFSIFYWRCPHCGWRFLWRMNPRACWNCGAQLSLPPPEPSKQEEKDYRYYIREREKNSRKYWLYYFLIWAINIGIMYLLAGFAPLILMTLIFAVGLFVPMRIIDSRFHSCPKCGEKYTGFWRESVPFKCSYCKTQLKHYKRPM